MRVGFLGVCFGMGVGWDKITSPCLKLVRVMLETWNLVRMYTHKCSFRKCTFNTKTPLILLMQHFVCKKSAFYGKNSTFTQINSMAAMFEIF